MNDYYEQNYEKYKNKLIDLFIGKCQVCEIEEEYFCLLNKKEHNCGHCNNKLIRQEIK